MRRLFSLALLLAISVPVGVSVSGCAKGSPAEFCNGASSGMMTGQVDTINLEPRLYGISLNYGETGQVGNPSALDCKGYVVGVTRYTYGTTNINYVDISPSGAICAGSWNRNTPGGVSDYTTCTPPSTTLPIPAAGSAYSPAAYVTASAGGASSNPVPVYVHPVVSSVVLTPQTQCYSQGTVVPLTAKVYTSTNTDVTAMAGPLTFSAQDSSVVSINSTVLPPLATAENPGATVLTAYTSNSSSSGSASSTGLFYTCPPKSITLSNASTGSTSFSLNANTPQALTATVVDTNNTVITGLNLEYLSTSPRSVNANAGSVSATYPGVGAITAVCQPPFCNNAPLNLLGLYGNGLPVTSDPVTVTTPGTTGTVLIMASDQSQYFAVQDFYTGNLSSPVRLPYVPNSMLSDQAGQTLFFGSPYELMEVSTISDNVTKEDPTVRGTVVGVSPDGSTVVISDSIHQLIYIYNVSSASSISYGGVATRAVFSPDNQYIYITGQYPANTATPTYNFFVYSVMTGWHSFNLSTTPVDVAVTVPSIGAYLAGTTTTAVGYCSKGTPPTTASTFFPLADSKAVATDRVVATYNSQHILGAAAATKQLVDLNFTLPSYGGTNNPGACPATGYTFTSVPFTVALPITPSAITGVQVSQDSTVAFVTYKGTSGILPAYKPVTSGLGTVNSVALSGTATAPVAGIYSPDGQSFFAGTSGDNLVHIIGVTALTDTKTIAPALPICTTQDSYGNCTATGTGSAVPDLLAVKPRPTT